MFLRLLALALFAASNALAQPPQTTQTRGVTEKQIRELLVAGVNTSRIEQAVKERGIDFEPTEATLSSLRSAGANDALLAALRAATPSPPGMDELLRLVASKRDPQKIAMLVQKRGICFDPTAQELDTLRIAGASDVLVEAVRTARQVSPAKDSPSGTNVLSPPQLKLPQMQASNQWGDPKGVSAPASNGPGSGGAYSVGGDVSAPKEVFAPSPEYPEEARKAKVQGVVVLSIVVDAQGNATDIRVLKPLGMGLDEKAVEKVRSWKFIPGKRNGVAVPVRVVLEVTFRFWDEGPLPPERLPVDTKLPPQVQGRLGFAFAEMDWHDPQKVTWDRFAGDVIYWWTRQGGSGKFPRLSAVPAQIAAYAIVWRSLEYPYSYGGGTTITTAIRIEVYHLVHGQIQFPPAFISKNTSSVMGAFKDAAKYLTKNAAEP